MQHHTKRRIGTAIFLMTIVCAISSESNSEEGSGETMPPPNITRGGNEPSADHLIASVSPGGTSSGGSETSPDPQIASGPPTDITSRDSGTSPDPRIASGPPTDITSRDSGTSPDPRIASGPPTDITSRDSGTSPDPWIASGPPTDITSRDSGTSADPRIASGPPTDITSRDSETSPDPRIASGPPTDITSRDSGTSPDPRIASGPPTDITSRDSETSPDPQIASRPPTDITPGGNKTAAEHLPGTAPATDSTQGNAMLSVTSSFLLSRNTSITVIAFEEPLAKVLLLGVSLQQLRKSYYKIVREKYHDVMVKSKLLAVTEATYQINCEIKYSRRNQSVPSRMRRRLLEFDLGNMDRNIEVSIREGLNKTIHNISLVSKVIGSLINDSAKCAAWDIHCAHLRSVLNSTNASHILALINSGNSTSALISLSAALFNLNLSITSFEPSVTPLVEDGSSTSCTSHSGFTCDRLNDPTDSTSSSPPPPSESPWSASSPLVIGLSCGGAAILIVCTIVIIVVKRRSIKQSKHKDHDLDEQFTMKDYRRHVVFKADASMDAYKAIEEIDKVVS